MLWMMLFPFHLYLWHCWTMATLDSTLMRKKPGKNAKKDSLTLQMVMYALLKYRHALKTENLHIFKIYVMDMEPEQLSCMCYAGIRMILCPNIYCPL